MFGQHVVNVLFALSLQGSAAKKWTNCFRSCIMAASGSRAGGSGGRWLPDRAVLTGVRARTDGSGGKWLQNAWSCRLMASSAGGSGRCAPEPTILAASGSRTGGSGGSRGLQNGRSWPGRAPEPTVLAARGSRTGGSAWRPMASGTGGSGQGRAPREQVVLDSWWHVAPRMRDSNQGRAAEPMVLAASDSRTDGSGGLWLTKWAVLVRGALHNQELWGTSLQNEWFWRPATSRTSGSGQDRAPEATVLGADWLQNGWFWQAVVSRTIGSSQERAPEPMVLAASGSRKGGSAGPKYTGPSPK